MSKYLEFEEKGNMVFVMNKSKSSCLGEIIWYQPWREYVFDPRKMVIFSVECLEDIVQKIKIMNEGR